MTRTSTRYPAILDASAAVLIRAEPNEKVTPELVARALCFSATFPLMASSFEMIRADLDKANLLDDDGCLTPVANRYGEFLRRWLAKGAQDAQ